MEEYAQRAHSQAISYNFDNAGFREQVHQLRDQKKETKRELGDFNSDQTLGIKREVKGGDTSI